MDTQTRIGIGAGIISGLIFLVIPVIGWWAAPLIAVFLLIAGWSFWPLLWPSAPFFYFALTKNKPTAVVNRQNVYQWFTIAPKGIVKDLNYWVCPASSKGSMDNPGYMSLDFRKPHLLTIHGGGPFATDRVFPEGEYLIQFDDTNGHWDEWLTVYQENGELRQHILVKNRKGRILHETKDDADFSTP